VDEWLKQITKDRRAIPADAQIKQWADPEQGFRELDKRLVKAVTDSAGADLDRLGDATIVSRRDIMHFDMRALGPITKVYSGGNVIGLGSG
jgi:hypothetical protein